MSILTSAMMVLLSGVIKPRRPSLSTTAKPSSVTQYSMQRIYAPSKSKEGPPMRTHTGVDVFDATEWQNLGQICVFVSDFFLRGFNCLVRIYVPTLGSDWKLWLNSNLGQTEGLARRGLWWGRWPCVRCCLAHPSAAHGGSRLRCTPTGPPGGTAD